jgi:hypothetical protein
VLARRADRREPLSDPVPDASRFPNSVGPPPPTAPSVHQHPSKVHEVVGQRGPQRHTTDLGHPSHQSSDPAIGRLEARRDGRGTSRLPHHPPARSPHARDDRHLRRSPQGHELRRRRTEMPGPGHQRPAVLRQDLPRLLRALRANDRRRFRSGTGVYVTRATASPHTPTPHRPHHSATSQSFSGGSSVI